MFSIVEWIVFAAVALFAFAMSVCMRRLSLADAADAASNTELAWLSELELGNLNSNDRINVEDTHDRVDLWLHRIISQSGIGLTLETFLLINFLTTVVVGWIAIEFDQTILVAITFGLTAFTLGVAVMLVAYLKRRKKFNEQFPVAVDLVASSVEAGRSLEEAVATASKSVEEPAESELLRCVRQMEIGMTPARSIRTLAKRIPTIEAKIFAHTIAVHQEMGGPLGQTLRRMANVIRQRSDDIQKVRAATSLGRFAAVFICSIGMIALTYMLIFHPDYISKLMESPLGRKMAIYAIISEVVGIGCVLLTLQGEA